MHKSSKPHLSLIIFLTVAIALVFPRVAFASEVIESYEAEINGYQVSLGFLAEIKPGENQVHVKIFDPQGQPLTAGEVEVMLMPVEEEGHEEADSHSEPSVEPASEHGSMPGMEMNSEPVAESSNEMQAKHAEVAAIALEAGHESGEYEGVLHFETSGEWNVVVHFMAEDELLEVEFPVTVTGTFSKQGVLAGIFGLNVAIISTAAVLKRNKAKKSL